MHLAIRDGETAFPECVIKAEIPKEIRRELALQVEEEGVVCYSDQEVERAKATLDREGIAYTIDRCEVPEATKEKVRGLKYSSRTEVMDHIEKGKEPESTRIDRLEARIAELEKAIAQTER